MASSSYKRILFPCRRWLRPNPKDIGTEFSFEANYRCGVKAKDSDSDGDSESNSDSDSDTLIEYDSSDNETNDDALFYDLYPLKSQTVKKIDNRSC